MTKNFPSTGAMNRRRQKKKKKTAPEILCRSDSLINTLRFHKVPVGGAYLNCSHPDSMCSIALEEGALGLSQE